jgi:hypothetical protein
MRNAMLALTGVRPYVMFVTVLSANRSAFATSIQSPMCAWSDAELRRGASTLGTHCAHGVRFVQYESSAAPLAEHRERFDVGRQRRWQRQR